MENSRDDVTNTSIHHGGTSMKVLLIANEPISADRVRATLGDTTDDAEIMVIAPALHQSALRFWLSDSDEAMQRAERIQRATVEDLGHKGLHAHGGIGEGNPVTAVRDALHTFPADRIVLFARPASERRYAEAIDAEALGERFGLPVQRADRLTPSLSEI
jgi:hypothetical protein